MFRSGESHVCVQRRVSRECHGQHGGCRCSLYQPIIGRDRQVKGYEALAKALACRAAALSGHRLRRARRGRHPAPGYRHAEGHTARSARARAKGPYALSINFNPALSSPTYRNLLLLVLLQARKLGIAIWFEVLEQVRIKRQHRK